MTKLDMTYLGVIETHPVWSFENRRTLHPLNATPTAQGDQPVCQLIYNLLYPHTELFQIDLGLAEGDAHGIGAVGIMQ